VSWANALQLATAVAGKRFGREQAADTAAPLGARIGSVLSFKIGPFVRASGSLVVQPQHLERVVSISRLRVPIDGAIHRLYTSRGDADTETAEAFVEVYSDAGGAVQELAYYRRLLRLIPTSADDQAAYTGESGQGLGQATFSLWQQQMSGVGLDQRVIEEAFAQSETIEYLRSAGEPGVEFIPPYVGIENRIDESSGATGLRQEVVFMQYERTLSGGSVEKLLISTEVVKDRNGDVGAREIHVDFMAGLALAKEDVMVQ
jgi:hypothetical protein